MIKDLLVLFPSKSDEKTYSEVTKYLDKNKAKYDFKLSSVASFFLTLIIPLLIAVFGVASFLTILGITGAVSGGLQGILLVFMYWKAKLLGDRRPEYSLGQHHVLGSLFLLMFFLGIVYTIWNLF